jgi:hypothetical protein
MPYRFRDSWLVRAGLILFVVGFGPLLGVIAAAKLGLTHDPNPNPIGPGLLAFVSFYPSVGMILCGLLNVARKNRKAV